MAATLLVTEGAKDAARRGYVGLETLESFSALRKQGSGDSSTSSGTFEDDDDAFGGRSKRTRGGICAFDDEEDEGPGLACASTQPTIFEEHGFAPRPPALALGSPSLAAPAPGGKSPSTSGVARRGKAKKTASASSSTKKLIANAPLEDLE